MLKKWLAATEPNTGGEGGVMNFEARAKETIAYQDSGLLEYADDIEQALREAYKEGLKDAAKEIRELECHLKS